MTVRAPIRINSGRQSARAADVRRNASAQPARTQIDPTAETASTAAPSLNTLTPVETIAAQWKERVGPLKTTD
jgi:hypothetical protein